MSKTGRRNVVRLTDQEFAWIKLMRQAAKCADKLPFLTEVGAMKAAIKRMTRLTDPAPPLRAYHCHICEKWHLTSQPPR